MRHESNTRIKEMQEDSFCQKAASQTEKRISYNSDRGLLPLACKDNLCAKIYFYVLITPVYEVTLYV